MEDSTAIPGASGCSAHACSFRDELASFKSRGITRFGLSAESSGPQRAHASRLRLPYRLLSDPSLRLAELQLPTFTFDGTRYFKRLTLPIAGGRIEAALYPVLPPDAAAAQTLRRLAKRESASDVTRPPVAEWTSSGPT